jgi:hypothetical protein
MKVAFNAKMKVVAATQAKVRAATRKLEKAEAEAKKAKAKMLTQLKTKITKKQIKKVKGGFFW